MSRASRIRRTISIGAAGFVGPADDVEVFLAGFEPVEDGVEQVVLVLELRLQQAEVTAVELDPESFPLQVFQPLRPQVAAPVILDPPADRRFPQVVPGLLAFDPLEPFRLRLAVGVDAESSDGRRTTRTRPAGIAFRVSRGRCASDDFRLTGSETQYRRRHAGITSLYIINRRGAGAQGFLTGPDTRRPRPAPAR